MPRTVSAVAVSIACDGRVGLLQVLDRHGGCAGGSSTSVCLRAPDGRHAGASRIMPETNCRSVQSRRPAAAEWPRAGARAVPVGSGGGAGRRVLRHGAPAPQPDADRVFVHRDRSHRRGYLPVGRGTGPAAIAPAQAHRRHHHALAPARAEALPPSKRRERPAQLVGDLVDVLLLGDERRRDDRAVAGRLEVEAVGEQLLLEDLAALARRAVRRGRRWPPSSRSRGCRRRPGCPSARRARRGNTATARGRARTGLRSCRCRASRCRRRRTPDGRSTCSRGRTRSRLRERRP